MLKYFGAKSSSSFELFDSCWYLLLSFDKGLQFISIGLDEELLLVFLLDFFDLDFLGGLLYFDLDLDFEWDFLSFELLSFLSFSDFFSFDNERFISFSFISFSFSLISFSLILFSFSLISFSFSSDLKVTLISILSWIESFLLLLLLALFSSSFF